MPKEAEFFNAASAAKGGAFTATKTTESGSRSGSTSSAKYRVSSRPSGLEALDTASHSPETRLSATNVSLMLLRMNKSSASRLSLSDPSGSEASASSATAKPKNGRYAITTEALTPPTKGPGTPKLPQKLRQHVNRLRSQFASGSASGSSRTLAIGGRSSSPTPSPHKVPRSSLSTKSIGSRRFSYAAAAALQYSRKPNQLHQLQAAKEGEKQVEPVAGAPTSSPQDSEPTSVNAGTFQDLLRPLQSSLSCAGLRSGWSSDEDDEAEQLFRQSERENSRMLRVCCSIDNLMVSIGDHAQEQKQTEAIVRGASRDLVKLFQFALKQVSSVIFDKAEDQTSNNSPRVEAGRAIAVKIAGKEAQYAMEFILEINERIGRLYEFSRSVFVCEVDELRQRIKELEDELAAATLKNELLQNEMRDLRDFHEQNNASGVDPFAVGSTGDRHPELDDHDDVAISALAFPDIPDANTDAGECSALKQQCQELLRLLEMAKQEIRLSHHERDVQKARVVEISSALFHESELGHLRNQLQSEKKRVRVLERENLTLRESQQDQVLKVQALETLQAASSAAASTSTNSSCVARHSAANRPSSDTASTATNGTVPAEQSTVRLNGLDEEPSAMQTSELTIETRDNQYNFTNTELGLPQEGSHGATMNWFSRIVNPPQPANVRKTRKKQIKAKSEKQSLVGLSKFLASLLMTDKQLATAKEESKTSVPLHVAAQTALREVIENNLGEPITLETFNNLLLKFAVVPSSEELTARLGPFYQPTGDERKIPTDVFLALLMETYKLQLQWQRDQLRALFIHLNHQEELQQRTAEKLAKEEAANTKGDRRKVSEEDKKQRKPRMKRRKSRDGAAETSGSKYLRGLSRSVLRELLLQSGIAEDSDMAQIDIDWLFAELLKKAGGVAADITFDTVYDMLEKMRWLDSTRLRVDSLVQVANVTSMNKASSTTGSRPGVNVSSKSRAPSVVVPSSIVCAIRDEWRVYARHSLALCNNDPNAFIRRHTQRLLHYVDEKLARLVNDSESSDTTNVGGEAIRCIREFLAFAWRVAGKRSSENGLPSIRQTCFTEVFLVSQALRATADSMPGYSGQFVAIEDKAVESQSAEGNPRILQRQTSSQLLVTQDALQCFYDTSRMDLKRFIKDKGSNVPGLDGSVAGQLQELESVLALYAAHIAHLFQRFSEARFNSTPQVSLHRWRSMVFELELVLPRYMPFPKLQLLFESVAEPHLRSESSTPTIAASLDQELGVGKTQFSELFVLIAFKRHRVAAAQKLEKALLTTTKKPRGSQGDTKYALFEAVELADRPARIMAQFCREILAPRAFNSHGNDNALVERNFAAKLSCPLVSRALLEHRSFLRTVFFYYAKQDEVAADERAALEEQALIREIQENGGQVNGTKEPPTESSPADVSAALLQPDPGSDFQLEKTKRSSMSFGEFQTFLTAFKLLDTPEDAVGGSRSERKIALADAQHVFSSAMSLDNDDTLQLEFDEFAAAVVALAVHLNPSPFTLWHQKLDTFAMRLRRIWASQNEGTCSG
ncbi:hypothetical protein PF006_g7804 [Phytophthora fragariae]|uniref:Uncharacterized protein n=1 Tax=Phytophthora fragariae TaxID=53985 RepID=A0A6A3UB03_9STRA|nr:hypothetical protein PF006_g7804 [Phytophthora fragariae]